MYYRDSQLTTIVDLQISKQVEWLYQSVRNVRNYQVANLFVNNNFGSKRSYE